MKRIRYLTLLWMLFCGIASWAQDFNPTNPAEPGQLTTKLKLAVNPQDAGSAYVNGGNNNVLPGTLVTVSASPSSGWEFVNWTDEEGNVVASTSQYTFTKGNKTETLTANFAFNPNGPSEPSELPYKLTLAKTEGGSVSGGGYYLPGKEVNITAYPNSSYDFDGWFYADGTLYSTVASTTYTMGEGPTTLTARFSFNPVSPAEPAEVNIWRLKLAAGDGGTVRADNYNLKEGESTTVTAYTNSGYVFEGWYCDGEKISETASFTYTMGEGNVTLEARFEFMPGNPAEPGQIQQRKFSFMLRNAVTKPGATMQFPIMLTALSTLGDMTLQLNFDPRLNIDLSNVTVGETATPYTLTRTEIIASDETYIEGFKSYRFDLTGGSMVVGEDGKPVATSILTFPFVIPENIETGTSYRITINQISMTNEDGSTQTAGTRNGRVSVYKNGDANGDNNVDVFDYIGVANNILKVSQEAEFIMEAGDVNDDKEINIFDYIGVANIILHGTTEGNANARQHRVPLNENEIEPE